MRGRALELPWPETDVSRLLLVAPGAVDWLGAPFKPVWALERHESGLRHHQITQEIASNETVWRKFTEAAC